MSNSFNNLLYTVILLPLRPASLTQKNSQGPRIIDSLRPLGGNDTVMYYRGKYFAIEGRRQIKFDCLV